MDFEDTLPADHDNREVLSVSDLTRAIKWTLESSLPALWVQGEISNFKHHTSGHMYFVLKDDAAQIQCVMWRTRNGGLFFTPQDGMKVLVQGRVTVYEKRGIYQLDVHQMQPAGIGELQLAFEQLKERLRQEGLFDLEHKQPLPALPSRIGIITSPTGAAIRDLITVLQRRFPPVEIVLSPVRVQGDGAAQEIAAAIDDFNRYGQVDLLIVGRGGGSLEDLWAFNEEVVARAIFRSTIPVIAAVGHEVDVSIADFVADVRAPTPSAAAEIAVPDRDELNRQINQLALKAHRAVEGTIETAWQHLKRLESSYGYRRPLDIIFQYSQRVDELSRSLNKSASHRLALLREAVDGLSKRLQGLDHTAILRRGYSLCYRRSDGTLVRSAAQLELEDEIEVHFHKGRVLGTVEDVVPESAAGEPARTPSKRKKQRRRQKSTRQLDVFGSEPE